MDLIGKTTDDEKKLLNMDYDSFFTYVQSYCVHACNKIYSKYNGQIPEKSEDEISFIYFIELFAFINKFHYSIMKKMDINFLNNRDLKEAIDFYMRAIDELKGDE
jgi:hypothetical protein